jgi:hypothetical protein
MMDSTSSEKVLAQLEALATITRAREFPLEVRVCAIAKFFKVFEVKD